MYTYIYIIEYSYIHKYYGFMYDETKYLTLWSNLLRKKT